MSPAAEKILSAVSRPLVHLGQSALDAWFPRRCLATGVVLGAEETGLCAAGRAAVDLLAGQRYCRRCGATLGELAARSAECIYCPRYPVRWARLVRVAAYHGRWADAIRAFKFNGRLDGRRVLIEYLRAALENEPRPAAIVPVPQHWRRTLQRKFNPVRMLADELARGWQVPVVPLLRRCRHAPPFMGLSKMSRQEIARQLYGPGYRPVRLQKLRALAEAGVEPAGVLLLDDITTTRSTLAACATLLRAMDLPVRAAVLAVAEMG